MIDDEDPRYLIVKKVSKIAMAQLQLKIFQCSAGVLFVSFSLSKDLKFENIEKCSGRRLPTVYKNELCSLSLFIRQFKIKHVTRQLHDIDHVVSNAYHEAT